MKPDQSIHFFKERSREPIVEINGELLIYSVPVACGHFDKTCIFAISNAEFEVLKADEERRYFLYAVLHSRYQSRPHSNALQTDHHIQLILFGTRDDVEKVLSLRDAESNGAVSNLIRLYMKRNQKPMQMGRWFLT